MLCNKLRSLKNIICYAKEFNRPIICNKQWKNEHTQPKLQPLNINFCTHQCPKNVNIFGDISGRKFEHFEMDKLEQEEEKFQDTEASVPRRLKPSLGQYAKMIKLHVSKKDLNSALKVLDIVKENRDKPTIYMYNLLLRAFAMQGDLKQCFKLYNKMKRCALEPNAATYVSLLNACAMSDKNEIALEHLNKLRQTLYEKKFPLNQVHYNVMIKAYSWHNQIVEAFQLADEMRDNRITIGGSTYNSLFHGAIADKNAGLRHALIIWHLMRHWKIKPTVITYNLFLRVVRDTNLGNLEINEDLLSGYEQTRILLKDNERPDLLASPPVLSTLLPTKTGQSVTQADTNILQKRSINLNDVLVDNRLILFGGVEGFLNKMANDNVIPNAKTITLLLDLIPNTVSAEDLLMKIVNEKNIELDIDFYNMLIKRRSMRFEYKAAKEVLMMAEEKKLSPNIMTFGVLALGCQEYKDAEEFLGGIEAFGYKPNAIIMSTLIKTGCLKKNFGYLLFVMNYMIKNKMKPNAQAIQDLEEFSKKMSKIEKPIGRYRHRKSKRLEDNIEKFKQQYPKWQKLIKE